MQRAAFAAALIVLAGNTLVRAQEDPLALPVPRPSSPGAYQWGIEMLRFDHAWQITKGRAHLALADQGPIATHEDLASGIAGPLRLHISEDMMPRPTAYHGTMTLGVMAARGGNGKGISGACPMCSVSMSDAYGDSSDAAFRDALSSGAVAVNFSAAGSTSDIENPSCANGRTSASSCRSLELMEERDVVFVTIAGNTAANRIGFPANFSTALGIGGLQSDGQFWTTGYDGSNVGSSYGPEIRLVAPSKDILTTQPIGAVYFNAPISRCGERFDSTVGGFVSLPASYAGYGDCTGTSFSGPFVTGLVGLMRSANPLLTATQVRQIILATATRPVAGPAGSGLTFHIPDAEAAIKASLPPGANNKVTPVFSLFAQATGHHLFTTSPQAAVAAAAGDFQLHALPKQQLFASFGDPVSGYPQFSGRICAPPVPCAAVDARQSFYVFSTENSPNTRALVPLFRMSQVCTPGAQCATSRVFAYATSESGEHDLELQGYMLDQVEGYVYAGSGGPPEAGALSLCHAFDQQRIDHILYAAAQCDRSRLTNSAGQDTGGNYIGNQFLGYVPKAPVPDAVPNFTGIWWNPAESGWGIHFTHQGQKVFATLFTYDAARNPMWLVMPDSDISPVPAPPGVTIFTGTLYRTTGPAFNADPFTPIGASNITMVGTMTVSLSTTGSSTLTYDVNGVHVTKTITPQVFGSRAAGCTEGAVSRAPASNYQDLWWNPAESGWGLNMAHQDDTIFATLFTYNLDGTGLWLVSSAQRQRDGAYLGTLYRTNGSPFDAQPFVPLANADVHSVGILQLHFADGERATLDYSVDGRTVTKSIVREVFAQPPPTCQS